MFFWLRRVERPDDALAAALRSIQSAVSSLHMPDEMIKGQEREEYMSDKYRYAQHAVEHLRDAIQYVSQGVQQRQKLEGMLTDVRVQLNNLQKRR